MKRLLHISLLSLFFLAFSFQSVFAIGALFTRPIWGDDTYNKAWIKSVDASTDITGQIAVTHVDQIFKNEMNQTVEAVWVFPLPEGAVVTELYYWFNGLRYKAEIRERGEARDAYNQKIRRMLDPALLEYLGDNLYRLSIAPINANTDVRTEITYVELLPYEFGTIEYEFLLKAVELSPKPLNRVSVSGSVQTQSPIKYLNSPSHGTSTAMQITQVNDSKYDFVFGDENFTPEKDLKLAFETIREEVEVNVLRYTPFVKDSIGTDSYYAVWITPPDNLADEEIIPKKIVFTADVSSSMEGERIEQLKESLLAFLDNLGPNDMFNIVTFGTNVVSYKPDLTLATPQQIEEAKSFVINIGALGLTNIDDALTKSLQQSFSDEFANMIVFITDGYPTWGETFVPTILQNVENNNSSDVRIFSFGVGEDVSEALLVQLAVNNGGYATFIEKDDDIATVIGNHFLRISKPVLTDLDIKIEGLVTSDKFPRPLPDLFWGNQVMQLGIYKNSGALPVYLTGNIRGQQVSFTSQANFDNTPGGHPFVPRLWAKEKIDYLMNEIAMYGENDELINQVIELSLRFQILTPYTAFYSDPDDSDPTEPATAVEKDEGAGMPTDFNLSQNYPNPFNPSTTIHYEIPSNGIVCLKIYDLTGRLVKTLVQKVQNAGAYTIKWDGTDFNGNTVAAGIYIYKMEFTSASGEKFVQSKKMSFVK